MNVSMTPVSVGSWIAQLERVRSMRVQRHLAVAFLAGLGLVFAAPFIETILGLTLISLLVFVVLDSLAKAMDAHRGFLWGWLYAEPNRTTRFDRVVDRSIQRLAAAQNQRQQADQVDDPPPRVRPI